MSSGVIRPFINEYIKSNCAIIFLFHKQFRHLNMQIITVFTVTVVMFLFISSGNIYGYPSASHYQTIADHGHDFEVSKLQPFSGIDDYHLTSNLHDQNRRLLPYIYYPHKRLIDF
ncbi:unnamed protein product [Rotaria magnacalcarata]|uniref:Uncharacterized protein n=1 Tax=Rotaria magnacalcarata TaxID=392030 RepID=A0A816KQB4_9BILA|nr:unnamed protein product [Rotaria magnacalcarata]